MAEATPFIGRQTRLSGSVSPAALPDDPVLRRSLDHCSTIARRQARNFYYGLKLTPEPKRSAVYAIYAFMRACDDLVDEAVGAAKDPNSGEARRQGLLRVHAFRQQMQTVLDGAAMPETADQQSIWPAFRWVMRSFPIEPKHLHDMLDGQNCDLLQQRYANFDQLYAYCYKVASVVGLTCVRIWGCVGSPPEVEVSKLAEYRGIAFQLTNILRDVVEDAQRGRVYLPADELAHFGYSVNDLLARRANTAFDRLMQYQIERARSYYEMSSTLDKHIDPTCRATSWALVRIYSQLLEKIAANPRKVLVKRVALGPWKKTKIALKAAWRSRSA